MCDTTEFILMHLTYIPPKIVSVNFAQNSACKSISEYAFGYCSSLTSITIPESVTSIGDEAFYRCSSLEAVYISDIEAWCNISFGNYTSNPLCSIKFIQRRAFRLAAVL